MFELLTEQTLKKEQSQLLKWLETNPICGDYQTFIISQDVSSQVTYHFEIVALSFDEFAVNISRDFETRKKWQIVTKFDAIKEYIDALQRLQS